MQGRGQAGATLSRGTRVTITVLLLVLPVAAVVLAVTAPPALASGWWWFAALNAVLPAVVLPFVWRGSRDADETGADDAVAGVHDLAAR